MKRDREVCWACHCRMALPFDDPESARRAHDELCDKGVWGCFRPVKGNRIEFDTSGNCDVPSWCPYPAEHAVTQ